MDSTPSVYEVAPDLPGESLTALSDWIALWPGASLAADGSAVAHPELRLALATVTANSLAPGGVLVQGRIPSIPGLTPRPQLGSETSDPVTLAAAYETNRAIWAAATTEAERSAANLASAIAAAELPTSHLSDIAGCAVTATELVAFGAGRTVLLVISDLDQDAPAQWWGALSGVEVIVVHACPDATTCANQRAWFSTQVQQRGAGSVEFLRPELIRDAVEKALTR